jgi:Ca2+:H+ antiporter
LASIGLTIPTLAIASIWLAGPLTLGLGPRELVLLLLTLFINALTVLSGRVTILSAGVHLVVFAAFLTLAFSP